MNMTTGQCIKAARKRVGITQAELAKRLKIPFQSISQWERDVRNPKIETLKSIAKALGVELISLLPEEDMTSLSLNEDGLTATYSGKYGNVEYSRKANEPARDDDFKTGDSFFGGHLKVTDVQEESNGNISVHFELNGDGLTPKEFMSIVATIKQASDESGVPIEELSKLTGQIAGIISPLKKAETGVAERQPPQEPPAAPSEGRDTTPAENAATEPPEDK